jgi:predicted ferric reductase
MKKPHERKGGWSLQILLWLGYGVAILAPPALMSFTARSLLSGGALEMIGNILVILAFPILVLQPVLAGRLRILDRAFGLDGVYIFHKTMGLMASSLLLCAAVALASVGPPWISWTWIVTAVLIVLLASTALLTRQFHLPYETWRLIHNVLAIMVVLRVLVHAVVLEVRSGSGSAGFLGIALLLLGAVSYVNHRLLGPRRRSRKSWTVESMRPETHNVWTLTFRPPEGVEPLDYLPGQFQFLTFDGGRGEEHPFTISSGGTEPGPHTATIKGSGDFTRTIGTTVRPGDSVAVQGPFGKFSYVLHPEERDLVFIAGGIGITPIMGMLRHMKGTRADIDAVLLYGNVTERDIVFRTELEEIAEGRQPRLSVVHVLAKADDNWKGERGYVNAALIGKYVPGHLAEKVFYICGPPPMMTVLVRSLYEMGVPSRNIRFERFAL